jgi:hypothetical protein
MPLTEQIVGKLMSYEDALRVEKDPNGIPASTPGAKLDTGKAPVMRGCIRYFPRALAVVAKISQKGARKYSWKGWEQVPDGENRYADARGRHAPAGSAVPALRRPSHRARRVQGALRGISRPDLRGLGPGRWRVAR